MIMAGTRARIADFGMSELALTLDQCNKQPKLEETSIQKAFFEAEYQAGTRAKIADLGMSELALTLDQCNKQPKLEETSIQKAFFEAEYHLPQLRFILAIPLKELPLLCLSNKQRHLSAAEVSKRLYNLKQSSNYAESMHEPQSGSEIHSITTIIGDKGRKEAHELTPLSMQYQKRHANVVVGRLKQKDKGLQVGEQLVSEFQDSLQQKGKTGLKPTISDHDRRFKQLEQGDTTSRDQPQQHPVTVSKATAVATKKDVSKMRWRVGKDAPQAMHRGAAVVHRNTAYFRPGGSKMIYSYQNMLGREKWYRLPDNPNRYCGLAVIDGVLTSVGGWNTDGLTNTLLSLTGQGKNKQWSDIFPPMPTQRSHIACASIGQAVIVAGGREASYVTDTVEVMNTSTKIWTAACSLPRKCTSLSASICGHTLFLGGGDTGLLNVSKTVLTCDITELLYTEHKQREMFNVWKEISSLPVTQSTLVSLGGDLLAIGGRDDSDQPTSHVYRYDSHTDSWNVASEMKNSQTSCLVVALPEGHLTVVGEFAVNTTAHDLLDDQPSTDRKEETKIPYSPKYIERTINEKKSYIERSEKDHALRHYGQLFNPAAQPATTTFVRHKTDPRALLYRRKHLELRNLIYFHIGMRLSSKRKDPPEPTQRGAVVIHRHTASKSVFACSLSDLLCSLPPSHNVWKEIKSLPVTRFIVMSFGGDLLVSGERDDSDKPTSIVYRYDSHTDSWIVASEMKNSQTSCLVVALPEGHLAVVGEFAVNTTAYVDYKLCRRTSLSGNEKIKRIPITLSSTDLAMKTTYRLQQSEERMLWREGKHAPEAMWMGAAVVHGDTAYFSPGYSCKVYSYQENHWKEQWSRLPDNPNINCGLAVIDGLLTSVGGWNSGRPTNSLLSLTGEGKRKEWSQVHPPMPTARTHVTCFTIDNALIVAGGLGVNYDSIIVMNVKNMQWATVSYLPQKTLLLTATACWGKLYLAGGNLSDSKSVFTCPVSDLVRPFITRSESAFRAPLPSHNIWKEISSLPVVGSTLVSFGNEVLAIGGRDESGFSTSNVYKYDSLSDTWTVTSQMKNQRSECLAVTLPHHRLVVVGGYTKRDRLTTDSVEISGTRPTYKNVCIQVLGSDMHIHKGLKTLHRSKSLDLTSTTLVKQLFTASRALSATSLSTAEVTVQNLSSLIPSSHLNNPPFSKCCSNKDGNEGVVSKLQWWEGENVPEEMRRGAAVVHENTAYFRPAYSHKVYSYQCIHGNKKWSRLPDNCNQNCGLAVINGLLTSVGGWNNSPTNTLLSLRGVGESQEWFQIFPSMPTPRSHVACITIEEALVVAGGLGVNYEFLDTIIIMNTNPINNIMQWTTPSSLPRRGIFNATECTGTLYLIGGSLTDSKSVFTCFVLDLFMLSLTRSESAFGAPLPSCNVWKEISSLPVVGSTLVSFGNEVLAIGGRDESGFNTSNVYKYDSLSDTWTITSQMKNQRSECLAVTLPHHRLVVVGGYTKRDNDHVEIMSFDHYRPFKILPSKTDVFYNQREETADASEYCTLPQHFTIISTLSHCTSEGRRFTDEVNDFGLEIQKGAIPEGERLTVDVAVSLFGPFQFPEGLRPVSPVFWVCVREHRNFHFSKPVLVTIPHFLDLENDDDITSLGLTFLKADHSKNSEGLYEYKQTPGQMDLKTTKTLGVIKMSHFCSLCLASKDIPKCLEKASFCITAVLPEFSVPVGKRAQAHFFITFLNLKTCLYKVKDIIRSMDLEGYCTKKRKFQFKPSTTAAIEIVISKPCCGMIGLDGSKKIFRSDVDFFVKSRLSQGELECLQSDDFYPPRFDVFFASFQENATLSDGKIAFRGATSDIEFNIHLDLPHPSTRPVASHAPNTREIGSQTEEHPLGNSVASHLASGSNVQECSDAPPNLFTTSTTRKLDINRDIPITKRYLQHLNKEELKQLFQELGLYHSTVVNNFSDGSRDGYAEDLIRPWILGRDEDLISEVYRGGATWENLTKALRTINHIGIADSIIPL